MMMLRLLAILWVLATAVSAQTYPPVAPPPPGISTFGNISATGNITAGLVSATSFSVNGLVISNNFGRFDMVGGQNIYGDFYGVTDNLWSLGIPGFAFKDLNLGGNARISGTLTVSSCTGCGGGGASYSAAPILTAGVSGSAGIPNGNVQQLISLTTVASASTVYQSFDPSATLTIDGSVLIPSGPGIYRVSAYGVLGGLTATHSFTLRLASSANQRCASGVTVIQEVTNTNSSVGAIAAVVTMPALQVSLTGPVYLCIQASHDDVAARTLDSGFGFYLNRLPR